MPAPRPGRAGCLARRVERWTQEQRAVAPARRSIASSAVARHDEAVGDHPAPVLPGECRDPVDDAARVTDSELAVHRSRRVRESVAADHVRYAFGGIGVRKYDVAWMI